MLWGARSTSRDVCTYIYAHTPVYCHDDPSASPHAWFPLSPHLSSLHPSHTLLLHYVPSPSFSLCFFHFLSLSVSICHPLLSKLSNLFSLGALDTHTHTCTLCLQLPKAERGRFHCGFYTLKPRIPSREICRH